MGQARKPGKRKGADKPVLYLLAGPNGAGKTTLYRALVLTGIIPPSAEFVNADVYEADQLQHIADAQARSRQAQRWADARRSELLQAGQSFASETVFSHESKLQLIEEAQARGFFVLLLVVALDRPERLIERVAQRIAEGGHPVPTDRILKRYPRSLALLARAVRAADVAILYDSQDVKPGTHAAVATCKKDQTQELVEPLPTWARKVLRAHS